MTKNIMIVGVGGQGTLLTSRILGGVMENAGYESLPSSASRLCATPTSSKRTAS